MWTHNSAGSLCPSTLSPPSSTHPTTAITHSITAPWYTSVSDTQIHFMCEEDTIYFTSHCCVVIDGEQEYVLQYISRAASVLHLVWCRSPAFKQNRVQHTPSLWLQYVNIHKSFKTQAINQPVWASGLHQLTFPTANPSHTPPLQFSHFKINSPRESQHPGHLPGQSHYPLDL